MRRWLALVGSAGDGRGSFLRHSLSLISGSVLSQAILFVASPLLARIFSPGDFGHLANYNAWVSVLSLLSNLRYEHAVIVAPGRAGMNRVMALAFTLSGASVVAYAVVAGAIYAMNASSGYLHEIRPIVFFIPLGVLPTVLMSVLLHFSTRMGRFRRIAMISVVQVVCTLAIQITLGVLHAANALVVGALLGALAAALTLAVMHFRTNRVRHLTREFTRAALRATAREHARFPRYALGADVITLVVQQFVPVFLTALYNPVLAGLYSFSMRVVRAPMLVVSTSVTTVLRKAAREQLHSKGNLTAVFNATVGSLAVLAVGPFVTLWLFSDQIFRVFFGRRWEEAGGIVRVLSPGIMLEFVAMPLLVLFMITHNQQYTFRLQAASFALTILALLAGRYHWNSFPVTCVLLSLAMVAAHLATVVFAGRVARRRVGAEAS